MIVIGGGKDKIFPKYKNHWDLNMLIKLSLPITQMRQILSTVAKNFNETEHL